MTIINNILKVLFPKLNRQDSRISDDNEDASIQTEKSSKNFEKEAIGIIKHYMEGISLPPPIPASTCSPMHVWTGICTGDIAGSKFEGGIVCGTEEEVRAREARCVIKDEGFTFTDDSVISAAVMAATEEIQSRMTSRHIPSTMPDDDDGWIEWISMLMHTIDPPAVYTEKMREYAKRYPLAGYGGNFYYWALFDLQGFKGGSYGNGSAMRSGTIGAFFDDIREVILFTYLSALPTHAHPEGVKGAVVTATAVWMAAHGYSRDDIISYASHHYDSGSYMPYASMTVDQMLAEVNPHIKLMSVTCQTAVPEAFVALNSSEDYESSLKCTLRYPCDTDTVMAITGGIAAALYGNVEYQGVAGEEYLKAKDALGIISSTTHRLGADAP